MQGNSCSSIMLRRHWVFIRCEDVVLEMFLSCESESDTSESRNSLHDSRSGYARPRDLHRSMTQYDRASLK